MSDFEVVITKENFEQEVLKSEKTVLLDFWASWCAPCRMLAPIVADIAETHDEIKVGTVDVDEQPELASKFGISSIPTLAVIKGGKVTEISVGYREKSEIEGMLI